MKKSTNFKITPLLLSLLSGLLVLCAYSVNSLGWVVWFAYCPLIFALSFYAKRWRDALLYILITLEVGMGIYLALISIQSWMLYFAVIFPIILALITSLVWKLSNKLNSTTKILLSSSYVASLDFLIALTPITAVMSPALCLGGFSAFLGPVSLAGFPYLTFLVMLANHIFVLVIKRSIEKSKIPLLRTSVYGSIILLSIIIPLLFPQNTKGTIKVAALDAGMKPGGFHDAPENLEKEREKLENLEGEYSDIIRDAAEDNADFIIMSEKFFPVDPFEDEDLKENIESFVDELDSILIITAVSDNKNIAVPVIPKEGFGRVYEKVKIADIMGEIQQAGSELPVYETNWGTYGLLICYDMHYEENIRSLVDSGANMIGVTSNANSYMNSKAWVERTASLRAAENHTPFVVSTDIGSYIVNSNGKVIKSTNGEPGYSISDLEITSNKTIYRSFGHYLRWLLVLVFASTSVIALFRKKQPGPDIVK